MSPEFAASLALISIAILIAWPAIDAWRRRATSRDAVEVAGQLTEFAAAIRVASHGHLPASALLGSLERLRGQVPEINAFLLTQRLAALSPDDRSEAALRLALRLKRRVAFERKMLARSASGLRRGAVAAALPPAALLALASLGVALPAGGVLALLFLESMGCWLLWRIARVEI